MCIYRIAFLTLGMGTLHWLCICMVAQLHAFRAQQKKQLLSVQFLWRELWPEDLCDDI